MSKIYIVGGQTGEYSDRTEWVICAYRSEAKARQHVLDATTAANLLIEQHGPYGIPEGANPYDSQMKVYSHDGVRYHVEETDLI